MWVRPIGTCADEDLAAVEIAAAVADVPAAYPAADGDLVAAGMAALRAGTCHFRQDADLPEAGTAVLAVPPAGTVDGAHECVADIGIALVADSLADCHDVGRSWGVVENVAASLVAQSLVRYGFDQDFAAAAVVFVGSAGHFSDTSSADWNFAAARLTAASADAIDAQTAAKRHLTVFGDGQAADAAAACQGICLESSAVGRPAVADTIAAFPVADDFPVSGPTIRHTG